MNRFGGLASPVPRGLKVFHSERVLLRADEFRIEYHLADCAA
jgi:hypothetical protein